jgi:hypothetical protein
MVKKCTEKNEALLRHEELAFPENHAKVMCDLLADWNIPAEVYQPLEHVLNDYQTLSSLPEPTRTKVELVKLAILIGQIAVGSWEAWDLVELPPREVLERMRIGAIDTIIEQTEAQLSGVASFATESQSKAAKDSHPRPASRQLAYFNLSKEPFDFLAEIVPSMGISLHLGDLLGIGELQQNVLVNRIGATPDESTARIFASTKCDEVVFVSDADKTKQVSSVGTNIIVPCSYAALRTVCWEAASELAKERP